MRGEKLIDELWESREGIFTSMEKALHFWLRPLWDAPRAEFAAGAASGDQAWLRPADPFLET
jgi:hypothetical protein